MKILLCEDDPNIATIAKLVLEQVGKHEVTLATDGDEALANGLNGNYDLILLDDMMPKKSGVAVCRELLESGRHIAPVIFMSANPQDEKVRELQPLAIGYIPKPFDPMALNGRIAEILGDRQRNAG